MPHSTSPAARPLYLWEKATLVVLTGVFIWFGWLTIQRAVYQDEQKSDFGVYARAAWAVRTGQDPYSVASDREWHYVYPPPFVLFVLPFADPPKDEPRDGYLRFDVSVGIWYVLNLVLIILAVHWLVSATVPNAILWSRRWWYARLIPFDVCLGSIGFTLSRGQTNILIVAFMAGMFVACRRNRTIAAGLWLSAAVCLKAIPAVLALYPAVRGQWRAALGCILGCVILLGVLPAAVWGVDGAIRMNRTFVDVVLIPGSTNTGDQSRAKELTNTTATDNQSFASVIHCMRNSDRDTRPPVADALTRRAHMAIGMVLLLTTAWVGWRQKSLSAADDLILLGCFSAVMMLITPVSHMHYYVLVLPLVAGLAARGLIARPASILPDSTTMIALVLWSVFTTVPLVDEFLVLREFGMGTFATTGLWAFGLVRISRDSW